MNQLFNPSKALHGDAWQARANIAAATSLRTLLQALRDTRQLSHEDQDAIDWTCLQTFGGEEPDSTRDVWSWDADSLLVGTCADDIKIVSRADWARRLGANKAQVRLNIAVQASRAFEV